MADASDVSESLADACAVALQMNDAGTSEALSLGCRVTREWPNDEELTKDLDARVINVTIADLPGMSRDMTRYPEQWKPLGHPVTTLTATVAGNTVTLASSETVLPQQLVGVRVAAATYVYQTTPTDTPTSVAAALAALVPGASSAGPVLTAPGVTVARVAGYAPLFRELRRQRQSFKACFWCPDPISRDAAVKLVDTALAAIHFLTLPDGTAGRLRYEGSFSADASEKAGLWRRDLRYSVEYPTVELMTAPAMLWGVVATNGTETTV